MAEIKEGVEKGWREQVKGVTLAGTALLQGFSVEARCKKEEIKKIKTGKWLKRGRRVLGSAPSHRVEPALAAGAGDGRLELQRVDSQVRRNDLAAAGAVAAPPGHFLSAGQGPIPEVRRGVSKHGREPQGRRREVEGHREGARHHHRWRLFGGNLLGARLQGKERGGGGARWIGEKMAE